MKRLLLSNTLGFLAHLMGRKGDSSYWEIDKKKLGVLGSASFSHWEADTWQHSKILVGSLANSFVFYAHNLMANKTYFIIIWLLGLLLSWIQIWKGITLAVTLKSHGAWIQGHTASKGRGSGLLSWTCAPPSSTVNASSILTQAPEQSHNRKDIP